MERYELTVEEMACTGCEQRVSEAAEGIAGVHQADADHETDTVEITADEGIEHAVREAIYDAGYDVTT